jgi:preprotein translocase subunit SecA
LKQDTALEETGLRKRIADSAKQNYRDRRDRMGEDVADSIEKQLMLQILDRHWKEHLAAMDYLRQGIHLRGYAQKNPEQEYKREAFQLFQQLIGAVNLEVIQTLSRIAIPTEEEIAMMEAQQAAEAAGIDMHFEHAQVAGLPDEDGNLPLQPAEEPTPANPYADSRIGRNDPCPCGSGKKYKHCHGQIA